MDPMRVLDERIKHELLSFTLPNLWWAKVINIFFKSSNFYVRTKDNIFHFSPPLAQKTTRDTQESAGLNARGVAKYSDFPQISAHFYSGQTARCIKMPLGMDVDLSPGDFVLDGDPVLPLNKGGRAPSLFSAHFYCAQSAGYIKMPRSMEVGVSPGEFVLDGDPAPSSKKGQSPSPVLRVEVENFEIGPEVGALPAIVSVVAPEQQITLVKTRSGSV